MARDIFEWNNQRGASTNKLEERPHVVNTVNGTKRYYSSVDAEIYFGDMFIDEVTSIEWAVQQQAMPIYGYNSYCFDDMAVGSRLVQGQFSVNFLKAGFLMQLQKNTELPRISRKLYGTDKAVDSYFTDDFRKRLNMPVWDGGFDIVVGFGDHDKTTKSLENTMYKTYLVLDCCQITGSMVQLDYNGIPVQEVYTFMARDIKYNTATDAEKNPTNEKEGAVVERPKLEVKGVLDISKDEAVFRLASKNSTVFQAAELCILSTVSDKSLMSKIILTNNKDGDLSVTLNKDKTKSLKSEIDKNSYKTIKVQASISTFLPSTRKIKKDTGIYEFEIKIT